MLSARAPLAHVVAVVWLVCASSHPDKNLEDPNAHDKFQKVGEAYQVLSNDEMRLKYDQQGKAALETSSLVDPTSFFAMLFGSEPFEHLIGELRLVMYLNLPPYPTAAAWPGPI